MMKLPAILFCLISFSTTQSQTSIPSDSYGKIGNLIWRNESGNSVEKLTWWNEGEEFASLGIGHCVWYPEDEKQNFVQVFPELLNFLHSKGIILPAWLRTSGKIALCPWQTREQFFAEFRSEKMLELRTILSQTVELQMQFIIMRTQAKLNYLIAQAKPKDRSRLQSLIKQLQQNPNGLYALIDYMNFKGDGTNQNERYNGSGWGLLQVLQSMNYTNNNNLIVAQFAEHAKKLLTQRVKNSPKARNEQKFLAGWINRVNTYTTTF